MPSALGGSLSPSRLVVTAAVAATLLISSSIGGWQPTWAMNESTIILWRNATGLQPVEDFRGYGVVMLDWAHAAAHWINDFSPMSDGAALAEQCELVKRASPRAKCVVYRWVSIHDWPEPSRASASSRHLDVNGADH